MTPTAQLCVPRFDVRLFKLQLNKYHSCLLSGDTFLSFIIQCISVALMTPQRLQSVSLSLDSDRPSGLLVAVHIWIESVRSRAGNHADKGKVSCFSLIKGRLTVRLFRTKIIINPQVNTRWPKSNRKEVSFCWRCHNVKLLCYDISEKKQF